MWASGSRKGQTAEVLSTEVVIQRPYPGPEEKIMKNIITPVQRDRFNRVTEDFSEIICASLACIAIPSGVTIIIIGIMNIFSKPF